MHLAQRFTRCQGQSLYSNGEGKLEIFEQSRIIKIACFPHIPSSKNMSQKQQQKKPEPVIPESHLVPG